MALNTEEDLSRTGSELQLQDSDRFAGYEPERDRSNLGAFLMGGIVVAGGLLAFLYYDTENLNRPANGDLGSIGRTEPLPALPNLRASPANPNEAGKQ